MIIEIRHYTIKSGHREEFIKFFEQTNRKALKAAGMLIFGPMRDLENPDKVHWMRAFQSLEERDRIKDSFYDGPVWNKNIEPLVMPMIVRYDVELTETTEDFENFEGVALSI